MIKKSAANGYGADLSGDIISRAVWEAANCPETRQYEDEASEAVMAAMLERDIFAELDARDDRRTFGSQAKGE